MGFPVVPSSHYPPVEFLRKFLSEKSAGTPARRSPSPWTPQEDTTTTKVRPGLKAVFCEMQKFKVSLQRWNLAQKGRRLELYRLAESGKRNKVNYSRKVPRHVRVSVSTGPGRPSSSLAPAGSRSRRPPRGRESGKIGPQELRKVRRGR